MKQVVAEFVGQGELFTPTVIGVVVVNDVPARLFAARPQHALKIAQRIRDHLGDGVRLVLGVFENDLVQAPREPFLPQDLMQQDR